MKNKILTTLILSLGCIGFANASEDPDPMPYKSWIIDYLVEHQCEPITLDEKDQFVFRCVKDGQAFPVRIEREFLLSEIDRENESALEYIQE